MFLDENREAVNIVMKNCKNCGVFDRSRVNIGEAARYLSACHEQFDIVLLDPPYAAGLLEPAIAHLTAFDILNPHGIIVAEHPAERSLQPPAAPYRVRRAYRYGKIAVTVICRDPDQENEE